MLHSEKILHLRDFPAATRTRTFLKEAGGLGTSAQTRCHCQRDVKRIVLERAARLGS